jgi:hypothetical protein
MQRQKKPKNWLFGAVFKMVIRLQTCRMMREQLLYM